MQSDALSGHLPQHGPESGKPVSESHTAKQTPSEKKDESHCSVNLPDGREDNRMEQSKQSETAFTEDNKKLKTSDFGSVPNDSCFPVKKQLNAKQQMHHNWNRKLYEGDIFPSHFTEEQKKGMSQTIQEHS